MNIIVPMSGKGSRFIEQGYKVAKPFIRFNDAMMIEHVLRGLPYEDHQVTLVVQQQFFYSYASELNALQAQYSVQLSSVDGLTAGAACTALAARAKVKDKSAPVLFVDSDNIFSLASIKAFLNDAQDRNLDGSLLTFASKSDQFSYVAIDAEGLALRLREKEVISSHAIAGAYYFASYEAFESCAIDMLIYGDLIKNEYYMSNVYNYLLARQGRVGIKDISLNDFSCVGTPAQLKQYLDTIKQ